MSDHDFVEKKLNTEETTITHIKTEIITRKEKGRMKTEPPLSPLTRSSNAKNKQTNKQAKYKRKEKKKGERGIRKLTNA